MSDNHHGLYRQYGRLGVALIRCMEQLKNDGRDGIAAYYHAVEEIDGLMRTCAFCEQPDEDIEQPLSLMNEAVSNQDAVALSDVLENQVYPIVKGWLERTQTE